MDPLFPVLPNDLKALSIEELNALLREIQEVNVKVVARDPEVLGERTIPQVLEELQVAADAAEKIREELSLRQAVDEEFEKSLAEMGEKIGVAEAIEEAADAVAESSDGDDGNGDGDDSGDGDDGGSGDESSEGTEGAGEEAAEAVAEEAPAPVLASAGSLRAARPRLPKPTPEHAPLEAQQHGTPFILASGIPGFGDGGQHADRMALAEAVVKKLMQGVSSSAREKVVIASAKYGNAFPEERKLYGDISDMEKIHDVTDVDTIIASGGLCAPVTPYYELQNVSVADRPVRNALAGFNAVRGGINAAGPPTLPFLIDGGEGVGIKTAAEDAVGGTTATKSCLIAECPEFTEVLLSMVYHCLQFGNLNARAFPEMIAVYNDLVMAWHARVADTALLDGISANSTAVTTAKVYGAVSSLLYSILRAAAGMRSRHRMRQNAPLRVLLPAWAQDLLVADLVNSQFNRFSPNRAGVEALLQAEADINVSWFLDGETGDAQVFGAQSAGALLDFPDTVVWYIFPEGSFLFLDGGTLDLGIVRDSALNATNDFQIFGETFENIAFVGVESLKVTSTVCPTGETGPTATAITC